MNYLHAPCQCAMGLDILLIGIIGLALATIIILVIILSRKPSLGTVSAPPEAVLRHIAFPLRASGFSTSEEPGYIKVRVNDLAELKVYARQSPGGTDIRYEVGATPLGWMLILVLVLLAYFNVVSIILALYIHFSARAFARERIVPLLGIPIHPVTSPQPLRVALIEGLSEAQRLASEAYEYDNEAYQNGIGLITLASFAIWALLFVVPVFWKGGLFAVPILTAFAIATAAAASFLVAGLYVLTRRLRPRLELLRQEREIYRSALAFEVSGAPLPEEGAHGLELLLRAVERSFAWRKIRHRRKLWHDPVAQLTIFLFAWGSVVTGLLAAFLDILPMAMRLVLSILFVVFAIGFVWSIRTWQRRVREEDERERAAWDARKADLENRFSILLRE